MKACTTFTYIPASRLVVIDQGQPHRHRSSCDHNLSRQWHDAAKRTYCYTERHVQALSSGATPRQDVCNRFDRLGLPKFADAIPPRHLVFLSNLDERSQVLRLSTPASSVSGYFNPDEAMNCAVAWRVGTESQTAWGDLMLNRILPPNFRAVPAAMQPPSISVYWCGVTVACRHW